MITKVYEPVEEVAERLKKQAAARYGIKPEQCHVGHYILEGLLDKPMLVAQIDAATDTQESNISVALRSMRLASALHNFGLVPGDRVAIIARGHLDMAIPFYACHYMGYTICTMDPDLEGDDMKKLYGKIEPRLTFIVSVVADKNEEALKVNNLEAEVVVFDDKGNDLEAFIQMYKGTEINFSPAVGFDTKETPAWLMLTSGTTGTPKAAIIPYDHVLNAAIVWWEGHFDVKSNMILTSTQWLTSIVYTMSAPIKQFTRIQSSERIKPELLVKMINKYKPEATSWTPFLLGRFVAGPKNICDLSCFKHILIGGGNVEKKTIDEFKKICSARTYLAYGMTEIVIPIFQVQLENTPFKSSGQAFRGRYQYRLIDENGKDVTEPNKIGELWVKGYGFFTGYRKDEEEQKKMLSDDGWVMTGDIFCRDENDFYYYVERKKLLIRYMGFFVSPLEIEEVIKRHPGVGEACVVAIPNPTTMELSCAVIMKKNGTNIYPNEIFDLVNSSLPDKKRLHGGIVFVDCFPTTVSAKINRSKVAQMARTAPKILPDIKSRLYPGQTQTQPEYPGQTVKST
ncbi:AMP-binding enzyme domain-containing protein [Phthorimaea operculella]|nr:AMP-binding enzyme domain-containing protein [Phthorimaea operculella]